MSHAIHAAIEQQKPIAPRIPRDPEAPRPAPVPRQTIAAVKATMAGISKCQPGSMRTAVLAMVQAAPSQTISVAALEAHFKQPMRGYLQKLIELKHLVVVGADAAPANAAQPQ
jgi:hypothetical protein